MTFVVAPAGAGDGAPLTVLRTQTEIGVLTLAASRAGLARCSLPGSRPLPRTPEAPAGGAAEPEATAHLELAAAEVDRYLAGELRAFTVPVDLQLAPAFDRSALLALREVGYGRTISYGELAGRLGLPPAAARAVGRAMGANPVALVVPCHRVVGADGRLVGYGGGLPLKRHLLDLESDQLGVTPRLF